MNLRSICRSAAALLAFGLALNAVPTPAATDLGSPAPPLSIAHWIKGKPVDLKAGRDTNIFVVEFWATWCAPCRTTIPSLSALQQKYQDQGVIVVGITDEEPAKVKPFVASMDTNMNYTVAVDDERKTTSAYLHAFGVTTIPHAFIVDKNGKIVWHGNPLAGLDQPLEQILAGKFDLGATRQSLKVQKLLQQYHMGAVAGQSSAELRKVGEELLTEAAGMIQVLHQFAHIVLNEQRIATRQVDLALRASSSIYEATGGRQPVVAVTHSKALFENGQ